LYVRREQFQLLRFPLLVKNLNRSQPPPMVRTVQLAQMTQCSLTRPIGCAHRFHQRPVGVLLAILAAVIRPQKHSGQSDEKPPTCGIASALPAPYYCTASTISFNIRTPELRLSRLMRSSLPCARLSLSSRRNNGAP